ncbi:MAG: hypothetical protein Q8L05_08780 [Actinomycetota bacterium]|nr:hypothetical protein [Actinomycetota bacterium]MDP2289033.1 hypothetical protein [Actinomycetota bacterium]
MDLILVSGVGGAGVSTVAAGIALGLRQQGFTTAEFTSASPAPLGASSVWADATATFGIWLKTLGTAGLAPEEVNGLPGLNELVTGAMVAAALADPSVDAVIWDMGTIREAGRTLQVLDSVPMLLDRLLTGSVADQLSAPDPAASVSAWYRLVTHLATAREVISRSRSVLVGRSADADALLAGLGVLRLFGSSPAAVVLNRAPRGKKSRTTTHGEAFDGLLMTTLVEREKGSPKSAWAASRLIELVRLLDQLPPISTPAWTITKRANGYRLTLPLRAGAEVQVGRRGDSLLLVCDGFARHFELPPVLKRCLLEGGGMRAGDLILGFVPNPRVWREQS